MKVNESELRDIIRGAIVQRLEEGEDKDKKDSKCEKKYKSYFQSILKNKFNADSPEDLSKKKQKEFFDTVESGWDEDKCKPKSQNEIFSPENKDSLRELFSTYKDQGLTKEQILKRIEENLFN